MNFDQKIFAIKEVAQLLREKMPDNLLAINMVEEYAEAIQTLKEAYIIAAEGGLYE